MDSQRDLQQMKREEDASAGFRSPEEVEEIVQMVRLELYNHGQPCGPGALRQKLHQHYGLRPLPSESTIARILAKSRLTQGRTGFYESDREVRVWPHEKGCRNRWDGARKFPNLLRGFAPEPPGFIA